LEVDQAFQLPVAKLQTGILTAQPEPVLTFV